MSKVSASYLLIVTFTWGLALASETPASEGGARAGGSAPSAGIVPVDAIIDEVVRNNPEQKSYEAGIEAARGDRARAGTWSDPVLSGAIGEKKVWSDQDELTAKGDVAGVAIAQTVEWPGRMGLRRAIADRDIELAEIGMEQFRKTLRARARIAVYELIAAREIAEVSREIAGHFRALEEVLVRREPAGLTPLLEMRVIEAMDLNMQRKASEASLAARTALIELNQLRGAPLDAEISPEPMMLEFDILKNKAALIELARSRDLLVRTRAVELARQDLEVGLSENERLPAVTVGPAFSEERAGGRERLMAVEVSMPLPLWDQNQGSVRTAKARRSQAETSLELALQDATRRAMHNMAIYETRLREMDGWRPDSIRHFKEAAELADRHYRLGAVPVSVYVELQTQYLEALTGLHATTKDVLAAAIQIELLTDMKLYRTREERR